MGKKLREKTKKDKPKRKNKEGMPPKKLKISPNLVTNKVIKEGTENDLQKELEKLNELNRVNPSKNTKNKQKRRELVLMRKSMKKRLMAQIRRKHQQREEALKDSESENEGNSEEKPEKTSHKQSPKTIDMMREKDETLYDQNDEEMKEILSCDEYLDYFNNKTEPQILLTTSIKHTKAIYRFMRELKNVIPNSYFYYRKKVDIGIIINEAIERGYTDIIIVNEQIRKPYRLILIHLPYGPTFEFKILDVTYQDEIKGHGKSEGHNPELLFKNFNTTLGTRLSRGLHALFPQNEQLKGRELVVFHNQRDYIFFRYYRYIFKEEFKEVSLQEIGPRFTLRLLSVQRGTYDPILGDYEWIYSDKMGVRRRKFYL